MKEAHRSAGTESRLKKTISKELICPPTCNLDENKHFIIIAQHLHEAPTSLQMALTYSSIIIVIQLVSQPQIKSAISYPMFCMR